MQPWGPSTFSAAKPKTDVFAPDGGWNEKINPKSPWQQAPPVAPAYQSDEGLKQQFGIELAKCDNPFEAACKLAGEDTQKALWISFNWLTDPTVMAARDVYLKTVALSSPPLDREQLAAKVLALSEEKMLSPKYGCMVPTVEAKDRIAALKLYSDILGYTGKVEIDNSTKNITLNEMTIKLVKAEPKAAVIDHNSNNNTNSNTNSNTPNSNNNPKSEISNGNLPTPITLKLVGGASR